MSGIGPSESSPLPSAAGPAAAAAAAAAAGAGWPRCAGAGTGAAATAPGWLGTVAGLEELGRTAPAASGAALAPPFCPSAADGRVAGVAEAAGVAAACLPLLPRVEGAAGLASSAAGAGASGAAAGAAGCGLAAGAGAGQSSVCGWLPLPLGPACAAGVALGPASTAGAAAGTGTSTGGSSGLHMRGLVSGPTADMPAGRRGAGAREGVGAWGHGAVKARAHKQGAHRGPHVLALGRKVGPSRRSAQRH
jgi:hypothetical protein